MTARTFDPFDVDALPTLKLGEHGEWTLGDISDTRLAAINEARSKMVEESARPDVTVAELARTVGVLCEAACDDSEGLADILVGLTDAKKHGAKAIGAVRLRVLVEIVMEHVRGQGEA